MSDITITLPDGSQKTVPCGTTALQVAESIGARLAKAALAARFNDQVIDLTRPLEEDGSLAILTFKDAEGQDVYWHSAAHIMADAVVRLFPHAKPTIGPAIEEGFYYDFHMDRPFTEDDLALIEAEMHKIVAADEHPRADTSLESLTKLKPIVREDGTVTAGNASGVNDGACALLLASEAAAKRHNLTPRARILGMATAGVAPRIMGIGPAPATRKLLDRLGLKLAQMDVIELNEAFAAQALAVTRELGLADDAPQVNPNGGAIALGHPLGMSGARLVTTAMYQLHRSGGRYALCTMCIGVGQGIALVIERI